jgi:hypothetical protein
MFYPAKWGQESRFVNRVRMKFILYYYSSNENLRVLESNVFMFISRRKAIA